MSIEEVRHRESSPGVRPPKVVFFGRRCDLSRVPLTRILSRGIAVSGLCISTPSRIGPPLRRISNRATIPLVAAKSAQGDRSVDEIARRHGIPLFGLNCPLGDELADLLRQLEPDLLVVSCFPWRLPNPVIDAAPLGAINLHPSLLPRFRGPDPLFWAFQTGARHWGATVHRVTASLDSGPILGQVHFRIPDGIGGDDLEALAARLGGDLLAQVVADPRSFEGPAVEQDEAESSYQSFPRDMDLQLRREWTVKQARNFVTGVVPLGYRPTVRTSRGVNEIRSSKPSNRPSDGACEAWLSDQLVVIELLDGRIELELGEPVVTG